MSYTIILQATQGFDTPVLLMFAGSMLLVTWLFFIRPQAKRAKEEANFAKEISKGSKIVTKSGIHGKVVKVEETAVLIEVDANTKIKIEKDAISQELSKQYTEPEKKK